MNWLWLILPSGGFLLLNVVLWGMILLLPPVVVRVGAIRLPWGLRPQGMAMPFVILVRLGSDHERVLRHELEHYRQMRMFSPLGLAVALFVHYGWLLMRHRSAHEVYARSWFERQANQAMCDTRPMMRHVVV